MKQFFKITFACVLGVMIAGLLGTILFFVGIISTASFSSSTFKPSANSVFTLKLNTLVVERSNDDPFSAIFSELSNEEAPIGLNDIIESIDKAAKSDKIVGIYLNTDGYLSSYPISEAIRNKLAEFKKSGKFVIAYSNNFSQNGYYLSSIADSIYLNPVGMLQFDGLTSQTTFFKNALDKLGIEMQVFRVGTFKSAVEPFLLDKMSTANREQTQTYMGSMWNTIIKDVAESRYISADSLNAIANMGPSYMEAKEILKTGLISGLKYQSDMLPLLKKLAKTDDISTPDLTKMISMESEGKIHNDKIAILYAVGEITDADAQDVIYWENTVKEIDKLKDDESVKAVVLRINSPGGSAFAAEQIWEAIERLRKVKPVVTSMSTYAASGGYYIACNSNYIVAEPTTLTGSIGVFGMIPNASNLLNNKLGINFEQISTNRFGVITVANPLTDAEKALIQRNVEHTYALFLKRCADGRKMPVDSIAKIAEGRVWSGSDAIRIGLVDKLGNMQTAIEKAAQLANVEKYSISTYPEEKNMFEKLMDDLSDEATVRMSTRMLGENYQHIQVLKYIQSLTPIQARMEDISVR